MGGYSHLRPQIIVLGERGKVRVTVSVGSARRKLAAIPVLGIGLACRCHARVSRRSQETSDRRCRARLPVNLKPRRSPSS
jgi:hypothetical protein